MRARLSEGTPKYGRIDARTAARAPIPHASRHTHALKPGTRRAISYRRDYSALAEPAMFGVRTWRFGASTAALYPNGGEQDTRTPQGANGCAASRARVEVIDHSARRHAQQTRRHRHERPQPPGAAAGR